MIRVLLVDDEPLARQRLRQLLEKLPHYQVCGEAENGYIALQLAQQLQPDIVLMDIRMPDMDGLLASQQLAQQLHPPAVIFTTAYAEHALAAFDSNASGYLLKPIRFEALQKALEKTQRLTRAQLNPTPLPAESTKRTHIFARLGSRLERIALKDIWYFRAEQKYVLVRYSQGEVVIEDSLKVLASEFGDQLLRIHRNTLIVAERLTGLERDRLGFYHAYLKDCPYSLSVSRRLVGGLKEFLQGRSY